MLGQPRSILKSHATDRARFSNTAPFPPKRLYSLLSISLKGTITMSSPAVDFATQNHQRFLNELKDLLRIPSISTLPEHKDY